MGIYNLFHTHVSRFRSSLSRWSKSLDALDPNPSFSAAILVLKPISAPPCYVTGSLPKNVTRDLSQAVVDDEDFEEQSTTDSEVDDIGDLIVMESDDDTDFFVL